MGSAKSEAFTEEENQLATFAKALGHPARIAILQYLVSILQIISDFASARHFRILRKGFLIDESISNQFRHIIHFQLDRNDIQIST